MKKWKKVKKLCILCFAEIFLLLFFQNTVFAVTSESQKVITPGNLKVWNDGANITKKSSGKGEDYQVAVLADTTDLEEEYYSVYIYDDTVRNIKSFDGISFDFKNENNVELKINFTLRINSKTNVSMTDASFAILESADDSVPEVIPITYGTISLPANFAGTIYIPFTQLYTLEGDGVSLSQIQSWGITTVMPKDQQIQFTIGNIAFLDGSVDCMKDSIYLITISGNNEITVPNTGSVIESYRVEAKDLESNIVDDDTTFYLKEGIEGVTISKNGELEIANNCVASEITIYANTQNSLNNGKTILTLKRVSAAVAAAGVPKAEDVKKITSTTYNKLTKSVTLIQIIAVVIALIISAIFSTWFTEAKKNYILIKSKLYKIQSDLEEEEL
jgi:hypothetical protein